MNVNWQKCICRSVAAIKAILRHNERLNDKYDNKDINPDESHRNINLLGMNYKEKCEGVENLLKTCPNYGKSKNQVLVQYACVYLPEEWKELPDDEVKVLCEPILEEFKKKFGAENIIDATVHLDEVHTYLDKTGENESLYHIHIGVVPRVHGKDITDRRAKRGKRMNGKETYLKDENGKTIYEEHIHKVGELYKKGVINRATIIDIDKTIEEYMTSKGYQWHTHTPINHSTVEDMKALSKVIEAEAQPIIDGLNDDIEELESRKATMQGNIDSLSAQHSKLSAELKDLREQKRQGTTEVEELKREIKAKREERRGVAQDLSEARADLSKLNAQIEELNEQIRRLVEQRKALESEPTLMEVMEFAKVESPKLYEGMQKLVKHYKARFESNITCIDASDINPSSTPDYIKGLD